MRESGRVYGTWERPLNIAADRKGSIHDDERAKQLGFRGAWVSARVHLNVFVAPLLEVFGRRWFEQGTLSLDFRVGTLDREQVRAVLDEPPAGTGDAQVRATLERPDGEIVALGTASAGGTGEPTFLGAKDLSAHDEPPYELVADVRPGDELPPTQITLSERAAERMVGGVPSPWYLGASPWGGPIASPSLMVNALGAACGRYLREHSIGGVFIDGGTELRSVNGPVFLDRRYVVSGRVLARGRSPRTEYFWYDAALDDDSGVHVAEMRLQWRCMKAP